MDELQITAGKSHDFNRGSGQEDVGFEHYSSSVEFHTIPKEPPTESTLPAGYNLSQLKHFDWKPRYELEKLISPESLLKYEPVEVGRFRMPFLMRLIWPLIILAQGMQVRDFAIRTLPEEKIVAQLGYTIPTRGKGLNTLQIRLDPDHPALASFIITYLTHQAVSLRPNRRTEISVPKWMPAVVSAVEEAGFERRLEYCFMGLVL